MREALQIIGFGAIAVDNIVYVDRPLSFGKGSIVDRVTAHGGNVATALVAAAKLGARTGFVGWLNSDTDADSSALDLVANQVDIRRAPLHPDAQPIRSTITVGSDGDRFIAYDDDVMLGTSLDLSDDVLQQAKVLLLDSYAASSLPVVERALHHGISVVGDIEWSHGAQTERLVELCDHLVLPLESARQLTGVDDAQGVLSALWSDRRVAVVLTDGSKGAFIRQSGDNQLWHLPAFDVNVLDTTGAGDAFHGGYAFGLLQQRDPLWSARLAGATASLSVTGQGGRSALPDLAAVSSLMKTHDNTPHGTLIEGWGSSQC